MSDDAPESTARCTTPPAGDAPIPQTPSNKRKRDNLIQATPAKHNMTGTRQYSTTFPLHEKIKQEIAKETAGLYYGPVALDDFLSRLLPLDPLSPNPPGPRPVGGEVFKDMAKHQGSEDPLYDLFVTAAGSLMPSLQVAATPKSASDRSKLKPDISFYPLGCDVNVAEGEVKFSSMEMFAEFKADKSSDPFSDKLKEPTKQNPYPLETPGTTALTNRGQIASYAATMFGSQFRTRLFAFGIYGKMARLYCWDPSATVVSQAFDYATSDHLAEFLWRFNWMSPDERGIDTTITPVSKDSEAQYALKFKDQLDYLRGLDNYGDQSEVITDASRARHRHFSLMSIPDAEDPSIGHAFIISCPPKLLHFSPSGRQARTLYAYDLQDDRIVLIKQYWRRVVDGILAESNLYQKMHAAEVTNLPKLRTGNDLQIPFASTRNQSLHTGALAPKTRQTQEFRLHRLALSVTANRITEFRSTKQLVEALIDAIHCYKDAADKCKILHRDINPGSVIIEAETGRGMLVDWDLYGNADLATQRPRAQERIITWQFGSVALLETLDGSIPHTIADDMESFLWLLVWLAFLYTPYQEVDMLRVHLSIFDDVHEYRKAKVKGTLTGGRAKMDVLVDPEPFGHVYHFERSNALSNIINRLLQGFQARYTGRTFQAPTLPVDTPAARKAATENYVSSLGTLAKPDWMLKILQNGVDTEDWPSGDRAVRNVVSDADCASTRTKQDNEFGSRLPSSKSARLSIKEDACTRRSERLAASARMREADRKEGAPGQGGIKEEEEDGIVEQHMDV